MEKKIELYSIFGGTPRYIEIAKRNLDDPFEPFFPGGPLYEEPKIIMSSEELESFYYFSILHLIAKGHNKFSNIAGELPEISKNLKFYLENLRSRLDVIEKLEPLIGKARPFYKVTDPFFSFYFSFIYPNLTELEKGNFLVIHRTWKMLKSLYISRIFEDIALEALGISFPGYKVGRIWGNFGKEKILVEIDAAALNQSRKELVVAEVKWQNRKLGKKELNELVEKADLLNFDGKIRYLLIGRKVEKIEEEDVLTWDLKKLEEIFERRK